MTRGPVLAVAAVVATFAAVGAFVVVILGAWPVPAAEKLDPVRQVPAESYDLEPRGHHGIALEPVPGVLCLCGFVGAKALCMCDGECGIAL